MVKNITVKDILNCTNGKLIIGNENEICEDFCKDTRIIKNGDVYIGIKGENFDGSKFWKQALESGAKVAIVENVEFNESELQELNGKTIIKVQDTLNSLYEIAKYKRSLYDIPVIGVTGSVGKTSTKDIIASVLSQNFKTLKTEGNNNNNIGLPLTILKLKDHEAAVIEMGMNHFNEISLLTSIAKPTISIITNIGTSHIGNLGSRENILKAKLEILEGMDKKVLVINNDNDLLHKYNEENSNIEIHTYGIKNQSDVMANNIKLFIENSEFVCNIDSQKINVPVAGEHFVLNALCAITVGKILKIPMEKIKCGIEKFELTKKRMDMINLKNGAILINDAYNASFESMRASLSCLSEYSNKRKIAVLGDMFELGEFAKELHSKVGKEVVKNNVDILISTGENAKYIVESAKVHGMNEKNIFYFDNKEQIENKLKEILKNDDIVLIKASNGMRFFDIVENLKSMED